MHLASQQDRGVWRGRKYPGVQGISTARTVGSFLLAGVIAGVFLLALVFVAAAIRG